MSWRAQFAKFASVGAIATVAHYSTLILLRELLQVDAVLASTVGYTVGALVNYWLNFHWTFSNQADHKRAVPRFFTIAFIGMGLNAALMHAMILYLGLWYLIAQVLATGLVLVFNFICNRLWTFKEQS